MTPYTGLLFFYILALALVPAVVLGLAGRSLRGYGLAFSVGMLCIVFGLNGQLLFLAVFAAWELGLCGLFWRLRRRPRPALWVAVALALLPLALVKVGEVWAPLGFFRLMGVSYMTFRAVEVLLNCYDGRLKSLCFGDLCYFLFFFPAVSAGPIDRFKRFCGDIAAAPGQEAYLELLRQGVWKLAGGAFGGILLGGLLQAYWLAPLPERGLGATLSYMYGYTLFLFCNFAGYSSMAIGTGYLLGVRVPENFRQPFLSVDMKEFWSRWHSTLSTWLRDYVYSRFVLRSLKQRRFRNPRTASYLGYLLTMLAMGLWHGLAPRYLAYGAYHSALMCLNEVLDLHWKPFKKLKKQGAGQLCCALVTFHLFAFGLLIFSGRLF